MAITIDQLNIELTADSKAASSAIDELAQNLERIKATLGPLANVNVKVSNSFNNTTKNISKTTAAVKTYKIAADKASKSTKTLSEKLAQKISTTRTLVSVFQNLANRFADWLKESNEYIETVNLFRVTMGDAADEAKLFVENVSQLMGIDPAEWMQYQGTFKNLTSGFGVASDAANIMSQNLTQLSYDLASFFNTDVKTAFDKLSSAMSGQVKGLREFGIDTTVATLQEYALSRGIDKSVRSMTQAEKALLRYNYIMEQARDLGMWNDMARTIATPANALRILNAQLTQMKRALGNIVSVLVVQFIPYVQAMVQIITEAAAAIATFFGFSSEDFEADLSGVKDFAGGFEDADESLDGVSGAIKKIKKQLMGFDELNIIGNPESSSGASGGASVGGSGLNMDLLEYDFLSGLDTSKVDEIKDKMYEVLKAVGAISVGILAWKLSSKFLGQLGGITVGVGLALAIDGITDVFTDGLSWESVIKGAIGGALVGASIGFKFGGVGGAVLGAAIGVGVTLTIEAISSMISEGVNVENVVTLLSGVLGTAGAIFAAVKKFNKKNAIPTPEFETAENTVGEISTGTSKLMTKLKDLAKTLAIGLVILAEVAAAAILVVGSIWLIGEMLAQLTTAWQEVIDNGSTVAIAIGVGTGIMAAIGVATAALGTGGWALAGQIAIGAAMLVELSLVTDLFLAEIAIIGVLLSQIYTAWTPVLLYGEPIAIAIGVGTGLLIAIGVVAAALGVATVATAGLLPVAIGLGTALLVELAVAFVLFVDSLVEVADQLSQDLAPALDDLNGQLPGLTTNMSDFTTFMIDFAGEVVKYSGASVIAGIAATIDKIIGFFTTDPVKKMSDEVAEQNDQFEELVKNLKDCIPDIEEAIGLVEQYNTDMATFNATAGNDKFSVLTFFADVIQGAGDIKEAWNNLKKWWGDLELPKLELKMPHFSWTYVEATGTLATVLKAVGLEPKYPKLNISWYAQGGFPESGQLFFANENGIAPELVGNIGRKTAVANNDQIITGIENGVYRAMVAANATKQGGTQTIRIINEIDGDVVGEKVIQYHNGKVIQTGVSPLMV